MSTIRDRVINNIDFYRKCVLITPADISKITGIRAETYIHILNGKSNNFNYFIALAELYNVEVYDLINYNKPIEDESLFRTNFLKFILPKISDPKLIESLRYPQVKMAIQYRLIDKGYFSQARTYKEILQQLMDILEVNYESTLSNGLRDFVTVGTLEKRGINDANFEYFMP